LASFYNFRITIFCFHDFPLLLILFSAFFTAFSMEGRGSCRAEEKSMKYRREEEYKN